MLKSDSSPSFKTLLSQAWPIILANSAVPLLGLIDTAVMGHFGSVQDLASLAIASLIFSFIYWSFGFLRMSTTGYTAQAQGANDASALVIYVVKTLALAFGISIVLIVSQAFIIHLSVHILSPPETSKALTVAYFSIRIWASPATLITYVVSGVLIGLGKSRLILALQLFLNVSNALLDCIFAGFFDLGVRGIALGTCIAEYSSGLLAIFLLYKVLPWRANISGINIRSMRQGWQDILQQNSDIFIRTLLLLFSFGFFTHVSGEFGDLALAANHILLQLIAFSAFFLDGYAHVVESFVGKSIGAKNKQSFQTALFRGAVLTGLTALILSLILGLFGRVILVQLTSNIHISEQALLYLPFASLYVLLASAAFLLDGVFIGASYTQALKKASLISCVGFLLLWYVFLSSYGLVGLWLAFIAFVCLRAVALLLFFPNLMQRFDRIP